MGGEMLNGDNGDGSSRDGRNARGQWVKGASGNPNGRPRNKQVVPKSLTEQLADAMSVMVAVVDARGKQKLVPAGQAAALRLAQLLPTMEINQLLRSLLLMDKLNVFQEMWMRAGGPSQQLTPEQARERLAAKLAELRQRKS